METVENQRTINGKVLALFLGLLIIGGIAFFFLLGEKDTEKNTAKVSGPVYTVLQTAANHGEAAVFSGLIADAGLVNTLSKSGPYTLLVPNDTAFSSFDAASLEALKADQEALRRLLEAHIISGDVSVLDASKLQTVKTYDIDTARTVIQQDGGYRIDSARVVESDIRSSNGRIHVIDQVLPAGS